MRDSGSACCAMGQPETKIGDLCTERGMTRQTLYRHVSPTGELRPDGEKLLTQDSHHLGNEPVC